MEQGREIVYTKGKYQESERHFESERPPIFPDKPLIILVDDGTASASEIVAGAIQDWDRGLILGSDTYGKGLVQQIFPISADQSLALKLTTAKYYVPSGRCIQREDKQSKKPLKKDDEEEGDSLKIADKKIFYTNGGRVVYGGGGIVPDVEVEKDLWKPIEINLSRQSMIFDFAIKYISENPDLKPTLEITDEITNQFKNFLEEKEFDYTTSLQYSLEKLEETIKEEEKSEVFAKELEDLANLIDEEKAKDFETSIDYIRRQIKREIVSAIAGERGVYEEIILKTDETVMKAVKILQSEGEYAKALQVDKEKKS